MTYQRTQQQFISKETPWCLMVPDRGALGTKCSKNLLTKTIFYPTNRPEYHFIN